MAAGSKANKTGANFRAQIKTTLEVNGFTEYRNIDSYLVSGGHPRIPMFARNAEMGRDIYGGVWRANFVYIKDGVRKVIHTRWQQSSGSVDQKFPFFVANARRIPYQSIFVLGGDGFKQGARSWLKAQVGSKIVEVFTEEEFQEWMNDGNF